MRSSQKPFAILAQGYCPSGEHCHNQMFSRRQGAKLEKVRNSTDRYRSTPGLPRPSVASLCSSPCGLQHIPNKAESCPGLPSVMLLNY